MRQRGIKPQRKNAGGRKSEQHPYHPHPKPLSVQSAVRVAHQESVSTATNEHARIDHRPSQQSLSARNEPSSQWSSMKQQAVATTIYLKLCVTSKEQRYISAVTLKVGDDGFALLARSVPRYQARIPRGCIQATHRTRPPFFTYSAFVVLEKQPN